MRINILPLITARLGFSPSKIGEMPRWRSAKTLETRWNMDSMCYKFNLVLTRTYSSRSGRTLILWNLDWICVLCLVFSYLYPLKHWFNVLSSIVNITTWLNETLIQCTLFQLLAFYYIDPLKPWVNENASFQYFSFPF